MLVQLNEQLKKMGIVYHEPMKGAAGQVLDYYIDVKKAYGDPEVRKRIARRVVIRASKINSGFTCVAGCGYGGVPLATAISDQTGWKLIMIRDKPKDHGRKTLVDGYEPNKKDMVLVVDDVKTTGGSLIKMYDALLPYGCTMKFAVVVDRSPDLKLPRIYVSHVFTPLELL
jgi:orotate phosphoribosyltransferase